MLSLYVIEKCLYFTNNDEIVDTYTKKMGINFVIIWDQ